MMNDKRLPYDQDYYRHNQWYEQYFLYDYIIFCESLVVICFYTLLLCVTCQGWIVILITYEVYIQRQTDINSITGLPTNKSPCLFYNKRNMFNNVLNPFMGP